MGNKNITEELSVTACKAEHAAHIHQSRLDQLTCMAPSRGCGVCKGGGVVLDVLQEPLEEGRAVRFSARLQRLLSGLAVVVFTVTQQSVH